MVIRVRGIEIDNKRRAIRHGDVEVCGIANTRWRFLMCLLCGGGMTAEEIFEKVYGYRMDGGPLTGSHYARCFVHHAMLKKIYKALGLKRYSVKAGGRMHYEVIPKQDARGCR